MAEDGCNDECSYDRKCIRRADWWAAYTMRRDFWGTRNENAYMPKQRLQKVVDIFKYCEAVKVSIYINICSPFFHKICLHSTLSVLILQMLA